MVYGQEETNKRTNNFFKKPISMPSAIIKYNILWNFQIIIVRAEFIETWTGFLDIFKFWYQLASVSLCETNNYKPLRNPFWQAHKTGLCCQDAYSMETLRFTGFSSQKIAFAGPETRWVCFVK